ncbi:MAG: hypothetical protein SH809_17395 [Rhodothermales bacterium]|nr:hypothetical protein [Rhodothermales bacterium]
MVSPLNVQRKNVQRLLLLLAFIVPGAALAQTLDGVFFQKTATSYSIDDASIPYAVRVEGAGEPWSHAERGPVEGLRILARTPAGVLWLGGPQGAARFDPAATERWERWQYFAGKRWLSDDSVRQIVVAQAPFETAWVRTSTGVSRIAFEPMTFAEKAGRFDAVVEARHVRHGFVSRSKLLTPGDLASSVTSDDDNDGLWTAMYLAAHAYRFRVTGDATARINAERSLRALMRLETIDPIPGYYARTYRRLDEPAPHQDNGEWHRVPGADLEWKSDTSSDETVGHYYGYAIYFDLVANEAEKEEIRTYVRRLSDYLMANNYDLIDIDGLPTRWGRWNEEYFATPEGDYERALRALELLAILKTTYHITGDSIYQHAYLDRVNRGYAHFTLEYRRWGSQEWEINYSDDELYFLAIFPLLSYEQDPALRATYIETLRFTWSQVQPERNALWNYMAAALGAGPLTPRLAAESRLTLARTPLDLIEWSVSNSHRTDVRLNRSPDRHGLADLVYVLAPDERRVMKHNGNPYTADGGAAGTTEEAPTFWLLPYWLGRHFGF